MQPILSISPICKNIYSEYYATHVKRKGKNSFKTIRLSDRISEHDIANKCNNITRMREAGERQFRIEANNDSEKSMKALVEFGLRFGKKVEPFLKTVKIPPRNKTEERWTITLIFS
jgi:translation initiation factor IF-3